jgi:hypothetical protein
MVKMWWSRLNVPVRSLLLASTMYRNWVNLMELKAHVRDALLKDAAEYEQMAVDVQLLLMKADSNIAVETLERPSRSASLLRIPCNPHCAFHAKSSLRISRNPHCAFHAILTAHSTHCLLRTSRCIRRIFHCAFHVSHPLAQHSRVAIVWQPRGLGLCVRP